MMEHLILKAKLIDTGLFSEHRHDNVILLKDTNFVYHCNAKAWTSNIANGETMNPNPVKGYGEFYWKFEQVLDNVPKELQVKLLFHLDLLS